MFSTIIYIRYSYIFAQLLDLALSTTDLIEFSRNVQSLINLTESQKSSQLAKKIRILNTLACCFRGSKTSISIKYKGSPRKSGCKIVHLRRMRNILPTTIKNLIHLKVCADGAPANWIRLICSKASYEKTRENC